MTPWAWYWKHPDDESYGEECSSRDDVIAAAHREVRPGETFEIIEARMSEAVEHEGSDFIPFLRSRNHEVLTVTVPVEPEYTPTEYLRLIAEGWEVIESTGSQMTIQSPEDDGPQDLVIDVDAMLSAAPDALRVMDREALIALIMEETTDDIIADGWDRLGKPNVLVQGCRYIRRNAPPSPEGYANPEAAAKQFAGFIADRLLAAQGAK